MRTAGIEILEQAKKLLDGGQPERAFERLKKILPTAKPSEVWRIHELIGAAFHDLGDAEGAVQAYFNAAKSDIILRSQREHFSNYIFALHYLPQLDEKILQSESGIYSSLYRDAETLPPKNFSNEKIHIAYLAPHFCDSSAARFFETLFTDYDREKFKVTAWSLSANEDHFTKKIRHNVSGYFDLSKASFEESAIKIQQSEADILFDLGGHTEGGLTLQIAAYRPAKIQISGIGYFDTLGLEKVFDYFLSDKFLSEFADGYFFEKILLLENAFAFTPNEKMIFAKSKLKKIPHENFVFGCLNNFMKITDNFLNCVKMILSKVPNSEIIFRDTTPLESRRKNLVERVKNFGLPTERVKIFCGENDFFSDYAKIDLILDTFPYPGGMMTALAIYMGVPVLNLCGKLHGSRIGAEMLRLAQLDELIVKNEVDYIKKAVELAESRRLKNFSVKKLTETKSFIADFEKKITQL